MCANANAAKYVLSCAILNATAGELQVELLICSELPEPLAEAL